MKSIAVINQKGGCGKTTIAINLSACLAAKGRRTLLVDMDPQSHCAVGLAVPEEQIEQSIYDVLIAEHADDKVTMKNVVWQIAQSFDLAPSGIELAALEQQLSGKEGREDCLRTTLQEQAGDYDYVVIDCPPSVGLLTFNALRAAEEVLIPVETGYFALHGLTRQLETLQVLQQQCRQEIKFKVVPSMYDVRTKLAREILSELRKQHEAQMCQTVVNFNTKLKEAASFGQPITEYDPASKGMKDFMAMAQELIDDHAAEETETAEEEATAVGSGAESAAEAVTFPSPEVEAAVADLVAEFKSEEAPTPVTVAEKIQEVDEQLEAISKTATDLLVEAREVVGEKPKAQQREKETIEEKIDQFYGVRQHRGSVQFLGLYPQARKVQLAGDFNDWQPERTPLTRIDKNGRWSVEIPLESGTYRYRYVIDDRWQEDPYNDQLEDNPFGELNSVLEVH